MSSQKEKRQTHTILQIAVVVLILHRTTKSVTSNHASKYFTHLNPGAMTVPPMSTIFSASGFLRSMGD